MITDAEESYKNGQYIPALVKYRYLTNTLQLRDNHIHLNLAHCYYLNNDKEQAEKYYEQLVNSAGIDISSIAYQQLGMIAFERKEFKNALDYFKKSLAIDPGNNASRYNYELTARLIPKSDKTEEVKENKKKPEKEKETPPPPDDEATNRQPVKQDEDGQEQKNSDIEQQKQIQRKLRQINLSEEKAKMILDAMKNNEIQYIQKDKKKSSGKEEKNLPDW
jgi:tetratricopeptide (TPR) repeat protein